MKGEMSVLLWMHGSFLASYSKLKTDWSESFGGQRNAGLMGFSLNTLLTEAGSVRL